MIGKIASNKSMVRPGGISTEIGKTSITSTNQKMVVGDVIDITDRAGNVINVAEVMHAEPGVDGRLRITIKMIA